MEYTLPIIGIIGEDQNDGNQYFRISDLLMHLNAAKDYDSIHLKIGSDGGDLDDSLKMKDLLLKTGKIIRSSNIGNVASAAVDLFLLPEKIENRIFDPTKGLFLIHNPWGTVEGDSETFSAASKEFSFYEDMLAKSYSKKTGTPIEVIKGFMDQDVPLSQDQISELGFATIKKMQFKAVARINKKTDKKMNEEIKKELTGIKAMLDSVKKMFKPKAILIQDVEGNEIDFPEIENESDIAVGSRATVNGEAANGTYTLPNGVQYIFEAGNLTEIIPAEEDGQETVEALKAENSKLKEQINKMNETNSVLSKKVSETEKDFESFKIKAKDQITKITTDFEKFTKRHSSESFGGSEHEDGEKEKTKGFTYKGKKEKK